MKDLELPKPKPINKSESREESPVQYPVFSNPPPKKNPTDSGWVGIGQTQEKDNLWPSQVRYHDLVPTES